MPRWVPQMWFSIDSAKLFYYSQHENCIDKPSIKSKRDPKKTLPAPNNDAAPLELITVTLANNHFTVSWHCQVLKYLKRC